MFSKKERVPRETIKKVISEGFQKRSELFLIKKLKNTLPYSRFAVVVSKKVSKSAVQRIYIKRIFKSALRDFFKNKNKQNEFLDFVILVNPKALNFSFASISEELNLIKDFMLEYRK